MDSKKERQQELTRLLDRAAYAYEQENRELMSNREYDKLYDELVQLEKETGCVMAGSPTMRPGYEVLSELPRERHESPMLSLDKTKDVSALVSWLGEREGMLSWKMDGLTVVLTYENGLLTKAVTRGNGEIGEVITNNARVFRNVPLQIPCKELVVLRGEAVIRYSDFEEINASIENEADKYKNPRNLCSGTVRQLNNEITAKRNVYLFPFALIRKGDGDGFATRREQTEFLREQGFSPVEYRMVTAESLPGTVAEFAARITENDFPSDGLVLCFDDIAYGRSLGRTSKFPRDSIAFKWKDETRETTLLSVDWSTSRTGLINPVAVFEPVELEGTTVSRASVHNLSQIEALKLGIGDRLLVYKANMIIPQIAENLTQSGGLPIPGVCPVCGGKTKAEAVQDAVSLFCTNPDCTAKKLKAYAHLVSRDALNVEGLSEATLEKLLGRGWVREPADLFHLETHREEFVEMEGFGEKSFRKLLSALEKARNVTLPKLIYSLGIPGVGLANAKLICRAFGNDPEAVRNASAEELTEVEGIGEVIAGAFAAYMADREKQRMLTDLLAEVTLEAPEAVSASPITGKTLVITGSLTHWSNRDELKAELERLGGKVAGSVSGKTDYLINNDARSGSSKNKKAKELGIPILSEEDLLTLLGEAK